MSGRKNTVKGKKDPDFTPVTVTEAEAFKVYCSLEKPTIRNLEKALKEQGHKVSYHWLYKRARNLNWAGKLKGAAYNPAQGEARKLVERLEAEGRELHPNALLGLQARLVQRIDDGLREITLSTPDDIHRMVEVVSKLNAEIHHLRGGQVGAGEDGEKDPAEDKDVIQLGKFQSRREP